MTTYEDLECSLQKKRTLSFIEAHPEAEFKELKPRLKFETRLKYDEFHLKMFQDLSRRSIEPSFGRIRDAAQIH